MKNNAEIALLLQLIHCFIVPLLLAAVDVAIASTFICFATTCCICHCCYDVLLLLPLLLLYCSMQQLLLLLLIHMCQNTSEF
jgi:hypothetical protein